MRHCEEFSLWSHCKIIKWISLCKSRRQADDICVIYDYWPPFYTSLVMFCLGPHGIHTRTYYWQTVCKQTSRIRKPSPANRERIPEFVNSELRSARDRCLAHKRTSIESLARLVGKGFPARLMNSRACSSTTCDANFHLYRLGRRKENAMQGDDAARGNDGDDATLGNDAVRWDDAVQGIFLCTSILY